MDTHRLVLPGDLNQYGHLFGGRLLAWVDEASWIAASMDYPGCRFVTVAMDAAEFRHGVRAGGILRISCQAAARGRTSVTYAVTVFDDLEGRGPIFSTRVSFVRVDEAGCKQALPESDPRPA